MYNTSGNNENIQLLQIIKPEVSFMHDQFIIYLVLIFDTAHLHEPFLLYHVEHAKYFNSTSNTRLSLSWKGNTI